MKEENNIQALYFSLVTHFLDFLEGGIIQNHEMKQIACSEKTSIPHLKESYPDKKNLENLRPSHSNIITDNNFIIGEGINNPLILIVGEELICHKNTKDASSVLKNITYLDTWLNAINVNRKEKCYIANIVQYNNTPSHYTLSDEEIREFLYALNYHIKNCKPSLILACGHIAGQIFFQSQKSLISLRKEIHDYNNSPLIVTYHPSAVLRNINLKRSVWEDLKFLQNQLIQRGIKFES